MQATYALERRLRERTNDDRSCCASRGLAKRFGDHDVLRGIDLDVTPGDRIAILGASGSGKSTLLRCLNFMELPTPAGRARRPSRRRPARRRSYAKPS